MPPPDRDPHEFEALRPRLQRLAYRMLGSVSEAEDVVQDAWLRWSSAETDITSPAAWLNRVVTRLCLDRMKSARARRETYFGSWLPEPLVGSTGPEEAVTDDVTYSLMLALERLSPLERAAFLLHDVFDVPLNEIAASLERDPAAVRQLASRARRHVQDSRKRYVVAKAEAERITDAFFAALHDGDTARLSTMLAEDVVLQSDGGGKVLAFPNIIHGIDRALRLLTGITRKFGGARLIERTWIDGLPGYISRDRSGNLQTTAVEVRDGKIAAVYFIRNPDKLRHIAER
ncbi:DNA-directed RNA polymerase sigma-70 factor [Novosphingobium endophyticum]|uniref:DNA-directed RNA polymerase sigma-70 factor n=1 Tax=Novosphingobium endophyticum TaxID=1955250 RepID=A0A916TUI8_9SPHN|nr:sigma-70 family RNA polymerase sigma factor [Novosphingobium endophyticum]GGC11191.1 DNA-directed RNA polymerase sigma-70 factor [Novosphingobium endophyticum]